jgi:hypothetical protein
MANLTRTLTGLAAGTALALGLLTGCSGSPSAQPPTTTQTSATKPSEAPSEASTPTPSPSPTEPSEPVVPDGSKSTVDSAWYFSTSYGCKVTFQVIPWGSDSYTSKLKSYLDQYAPGWKQPVIVKAVVDYTHPAPGAAKDYVCGINPQISLITPKGKEQLSQEYSTPDTWVQKALDRAMNPDNADVYNQGIALIDKMPRGASWHTKGIDYAFFSHVKPFIAVAIQPHGMGGETINEVVKSDADLVTGKPGHFPTQTRTDKDKSFTVLGTKAKGSKVGIHVKVCGSDIDPQRWMFLVGTQGAMAPAEDGSAFGATETEGDCVTGWIKFTSYDGLYPTSVAYDTKSNDPETQFLTFVL